MTFGTFETFGTKKRSFLGESDTRECLPTLANDRGRCARSLRQLPDPQNPNLKTRTLLLGIREQQRNVVQGSSVRVPNY